VEDVNTAEARLSTKKKLAIFAMGDTFLGYKYRFLEEGEGIPQASILTKVVIPTGAGDPIFEDAGAGLIPERNGGQWKLEWAGQLGKHCGQDDRVFVYGELTYILGLDEANTDNFEAGIALDWEASERLHLVASFISSVYEAPDDTDFVGFEAGMIYQVNDRFALLMSSGRSFHPDSSGAPIWLAYFGIQWTRTVGRKAGE
jgi:hypothetical protein